MGSPSPAIDVIRNMIVWMIRGKVIRTVLCCVVYDSCAQWFAYTKFYEILEYRCLVVWWLGCWLGTWQVTSSAPGHSAVTVVSYCEHHYHLGLVSDIAIFVLKRDVKLQLTNHHLGQVVHTHEPLSPSSIIWYDTSHGAAMCCDWEGNRWSDHACITDLSELSIYVLKA